MTECTGTSFAFATVVRCLRGFYAGAENAKRLKVDFLDQLNQCWLYCPDDVIRKGYEFLDSIQTKAVQPDEIKERAMGEFVAAIRRDLLSRKLVKRTNLSGTDFRHLGVPDGDI